MKRTTVLALTVLVCLGCARVAWGNHGGCHFNPFTELPHNTVLHIGPTLYGILGAYPQLWSVLGAARDAWEGTHAGGRIGNVSFPGSTSDCPVGLPIQLGAMDFSQGGCAAVGSTTALAVTDNPGTKSIVINTNIAWSFNPASNQYDVQSAMAHEFGHMLGFTHQYHDQCREDIYAGCADPDKNTMNFLFPGETCLRDLSMYDINNANVVYPNP